MTILKNLEQTLDYLAQMAEAGKIDISSATPLYGDNARRAVEETNPCTVNLDGSLRAWLFFSEVEFIDDLQLLVNLLLQLSPEFGAGLSPGESVTS